jgi:transcriptional regulator with XRE-family HTH domain
MENEVLNEQEADLRQKEESNSSFKKRLETVCEHFHITMEELARRSGMSKPTIYRMINGERNDRNVSLMANKLEIDYLWLRSGIGFMLGDKPLITTESKDAIVQEFIKQVNFLKSQIQVKDSQIKKMDEQIEKKDELITLLSNKFLKLEATEEEPLDRGPKTIKMPIYEKSEIREIELKLAA